MGRQPNYQNKLFITGFNLCGRILAKSVILQYNYIIGELDLKIGSLTLTDSNHAFFRPQKMKDLILSFNLKPEAHIHESSPFPISEKA